jgi:hypothetical protein
VGIRATAGGPPDDSRGWPTLSLTNLNQPQMIGCPILRALWAGGPYLRFIHTSGAPFMRSHRMSGHSRYARTVLNIRLDRYSDRLSIQLSVCGDDRRGLHPRTRNRHLDLKHPRPLLIRRPENRRVTQANIKAANELHAATGKSCGLCSETFSSRACNVVDLES